MDEDQIEALLSAKEEVVRELAAATNMYGRMTSPHEGWAIINEEVDELWDEIKKKPDFRDPVKMRLEARQIAAMAIRFMVDLT